MRAVLSRVWIFSGLKLETPMLLTKPLSTSDSMAAQVSLKGGTTSGLASSEEGLQGQSNIYVLHQQDGRCDKQRSRLQSFLRPSTGPA